MGFKAAERGFYVLLGLYCILLLTACVPLTGAQSGGSCRTADVFSLPDVVRPCCEAMPSGDCSAGFPTHCSVSCRAVTESAGFLLAADSVPLANGYYY